MARFRDMDAHERIIFILSVINIFSATVLIVVGFAANLANMSVPESSGGQSAEVMIASYVYMGLGAISLVMGVLGVMAARDVRKIMPVFILSIISLAGSVFSIVSALISGNGEASRYLVNLFTSTLMFYATWSVYKRVKGK